MENAIQVGAGILIVHSGQPTIFWSCFHRRALRAQLACVPPAPKAQGRILPQIRRDHGIQLTYVGDGRSICLNSLLANCLDSPPPIGNETISYECHIFVPFRAVDRWNTTPSSVFAFVRTLLKCPSKWWGLNVPSPYVYMYICIYVYMSMCIYIYIYI